MCERYPEIRFARGDTYTASFQFPLNGEPYILSAGDIVRFGVFRGRKPMIMKELTADDQSEDGTISAVLLPGDTSWMHPGKYEYERELITADGEVHTLLRAPLLLEDDLITPDSRDATEAQPDSADAGGLTAKRVAYDNTDSGLDAETVQQAIDELSANPKVTTPDLSQNDPTQPDYVKNRTHWVEVTGGTYVEILPEIEATYDEGEGMFAVELPENDISAALSDGQTYTVNWNGVEYSTLCQFLDFGDTAAPVLGDVYTVSGGEMGTAATGEPFMIVVYTPEMIGVENASLLAIFPLDGSTELTLSISGMNGSTRTVHKLSDEFIDAEWLAKRSVVTRTVLETQEYATGVFGLTADMFENVKEIRVIVTIDGERLVDVLEPEFSDNGIFYSAAGTYFVILNYYMDPTADVVLSDSMDITEPLPGTPTDLSIEADFYKYDQLPKEYLTTAELGSIEEDEGGGTNTMANSLSDAAIMLRNGITVRYNGGYLLAAYGDVDTAKNRFVWVDDWGVHFEQYTDDNNEELTWSWKSTTYATLADLADALTNYYTQDEINELLSDLGGSGGSVDLSGYYNKEEVDELLANLDIPKEADLSGYYTKEQTDTLLSAIKQTTKVTEYTSGDAVEDNRLYEITVDSAVTIEASTADVCPVFGSHFVITMADGGSVTLNCLSFVGNDISTAAAGEVWEISVLCGRCVVTKMS